MAAGFTCAANPVQSLTMASGNIHPAYVVAGPQLQPNIQRIYHQTDAVTRPGRTPGPWTDELRAATGTPAAAVPRW